MDYRIDHSRLYIENPQITPNPPILLHSGPAYFFHKIFHTLLKIFPSIAKKDPFSHKSSFGSFKVKLDEHIYYVNKKSYLEWRTKTTAEIPFEGSYAKDLMKMIKSSPYLEKFRKPSVNLDPATELVPQEEKAVNSEEENPSAPTSSSEKNVPKTGDARFDPENPEVWLQPTNADALRNLPRYKLLDALRKQASNFWVEVSDLVANNLQIKRVALENSNPLMDLLGKCDQQEIEEFSHLFVSKLPLDRLHLIYGAILSSSSLPIADRMAWISSAYKVLDSKPDQAAEKYLLAWQLFDLFKNHKEASQLFKSLDDLYPKFAIEVFFEPCIVGILKHSKNPAEDFALFSDVHVFKRSLPSNTQPSRFLEENLTQDEKKKLLDVIYSIRKKVGKKYEKVEFIDIKQPSYAGGDLLELISSETNFVPRFFSYLTDAYKDYTNRTEERMCFSFDLLEAIFKRELDLKKIGAFFQELNIYKKIDSYQSAMPVFVRDCMAIALKNQQENDRYKNILFYLKNNLIEKSKENIEKSTENTQLPDSGKFDFKKLFDPNVEDETLNQMLTTEEIELLKQWKKNPTPKK